MFRVTRSRQIDAPAARVFAALADPASLAGIVPRVQRITVLRRGAESAAVATEMALGPFGTLRSEGDVRWQTDREVVFSTRRPVAVEARWTLEETSAGTILQATLSLDLAPLIGPFTALIPPNEVEKMIAPDLDTALAEIARRVERS